MNQSRYQIRLNKMKIFPIKTKKYYQCCICLEESKSVKKCSKCVEGIICNKCRSKLTEDQLALCPICRQISSDFLVDVKIDSNYESNIQIEINNQNDKDFCLKTTFQIGMLIFSILMFILSSFLMGLILGLTIFNFHPDEANPIYYLIITIFGMACNISTCFILRRCLITLD